MAKTQQPKKIPFVIRPAKNGQSWSVFRTGGRSLVYDFASEKAAQTWIEYGSKAWLKEHSQLDRSNKQRAIGSV
jgi:hypothetical protein